MTTSPNLTQQVQLTTETAINKQNQIKQAYNNLKIAFETKKPVEVELIEKNKNGFKCLFEGVPLFLLFINYFSKKENLSEELIDSLIGTKIPVKIMEFYEDEFGKVIKINHKEVLEDKKWETVTSGMTIEVTVKSLVPDRGIAVETQNGLNGFITISNISRQRVTVLEDFVNVGDIVNAKILEINREKDRLFLSMKDIPSPQLIDFFDTHTIGQRVKGTVETIANALVFVNIGHNITGRVRIREVSWTRKHINLSDYFEINKEYEFEIINLSKDTNLIDLSYKATQPNNWCEIANTFKKNIIYYAVVEYIPPNGRGVELTLNNVIDAYLPKQRADALYNGNKPTFKAKDTIQVKIFNIDDEKRSILVESALKRDSDFMNRESEINDYSKNKILNKNRITNFTFADLLSESSKKSLKK